MRSISVIIPILNEEDEIEALLRNLKGAGERSEERCRERVCLYV